MWLRVALDKDALKVGTAGHYYIEGINSEEYFIEDEMTKLMDHDNFLVEMWNEFDAMFDWGDCDFFEADKCKKLSVWLEKRIKKDIPDELLDIYKVMLDFSRKAEKANTGMYFDF